MNLDELLEQVNSKETFLEFVEALKHDKIEEEQKEKLNPSSPYSSGANGWENDSIIDFLDSAHAFSLDSEELDLSWKGFALFLYAGKFYE